MTDDPAYFLGYENENYHWLVDNLGINAADILTFVRNGFEAAFMPEANKQKYLAQVNAAFAEVMGKDALHTALQQPEA